jgi:hypothetical protein
MVQGFHPWLPPTGDAASPPAPYGGRCKHSVPQSGVAHGTLSLARAHLEIPRLRAAFDGRVITPDDPGYDQARTVFYGKYDRAGR